MKRSQINALIDEALGFFREMNFLLPPWATWSPEQWKENATECGEIFSNQLGWDLTDFGSGNFQEKGLLLFTLRNGTPGTKGKNYAEKIMIVEEGQVTPLHFHWSKTEDIINRGGGNLMIRLFPSDENEELASHPFDVMVDGIRKKLEAGDSVRLSPGESITLYPGLYHTFYGETGHGKILVGEVSAVNDDHSDNRFHSRTGRFPDIVEDVAPVYLLTGDYEKLQL